MINFEYIDDERGFLPKKKNFNIIKLNTKNDNGWLLDCAFMWKLMTKRPTPWQQYLQAIGRYKSEFYQFIVIEDSAV